MAGRKDNVEMDEKNTNNAQGGIPTLGAFLCEGNKPIG